MHTPSIDLDGPPFSSESSVKEAKYEAIRIPV